MTARPVLLVLLLFPCALTMFRGATQEPDRPDLAMYARIREEGQARSRVMRYATELVDGIGARLTGSPHLATALTWAQERLHQIELTHVHTEDWGEFGLGWQQRHVWTRIVAPDFAPLVVRAAPWSAPTKGPIGGDVIAVGGLPDERAFDRVRGQLRGRIVLLGRAPGPPDVIPFDKPLFTRFDQRELYEAARQTSEPEPSPDDTEATFARLAHGERIGRFLQAEGVGAVLVPSGNRPRGGISGGTLAVDGNSAFGYFAYRPEHRVNVPLLVLAVEHYGRIERLLARDVPVRVEVNVDAAFTGEHQRGLNVLADLQGFSAVFTVDAGGGRIRGVSVGSAALVPLLRAWIEPLHDLGVTMVSPRRDCGGDCRPFAETGLPVPVFTHDALDYDTRTHHTTMDTFEYLHEDDLKQAAVVLASVVYSVATRDALLARTP